MQKAKVIHKKMAQSFVSVGALHETLTDMIAQFPEAKDCRIIFETSDKLGALYRLSTMGLRDCTIEVAEREGSQIFDREELICWLLIERMQVANSDDEDAISI